MNYSHTIVTWDCCFRDFFHIIPSIAECDIDEGDAVEIIVVEQRSQFEAEKRARENNVKSAEEVAADLSGLVDCKVLYMNDEGPYHPGKALNYGLIHASGDIISTMDADILVHKRFLNILDDLHSKGEVLVTMDRLSAAFPCGVTKEKWKDQIVDYELVSRLSPKYGKPIPQVVGNKAPLLSIKEGLWNELGFYDEHFSFSTAYTKFGQDISRRFAILRPGSEVSMPVPCVHPWHPSPMQRKSRTYKILYDAQESAMAWSESIGRFDVQARHHFYSRLHGSVNSKIWNAIKKAEAQDSHVKAEDQNSHVTDLVRSRSRKFLARLIILFRKYF